MKVKHRKMLADLMDCCNELGGTLDGTSTNEAKYRDRQRAHMDVYKVLYAILSDAPENDQSSFYFELAEESINKLKELKKKAYPDRRGNY